MEIDVRPIAFAEIEPLRRLFRQEANCQIVADSLLSRGLADPYLIRVDGRIGGYGGVRNRYEPGRLMEFYVLPAYRRDESAMFRALVEASRATSLQAQTNLPRMLTAFYDVAVCVEVGAVLFEDAFSSDLKVSGATFRRATPDDALPPQTGEPMGDWLVEFEGRVAGTGGFLTHYNPPYADLFMEIVPEHRGRGLGSFLVQELKRVCLEAGHRPAARCGAENAASRRTLQRAGFLPCGRMLTGDVLSS